MQTKSRVQGKKDHRHQGLLSHPVVRVASVWVWIIVGPLLVAGAVLLILHIDLATARQAFGTRPYLAAYIVTQSIPNALDVAVTFSLFGLIYAYTGNSIGPMLAWTLINGQVWFLAQVLWS